MLIVLSPHEEIKLLDCLNQGATGGYRVTQGVTGGYKGLQAVKRG